MGTLITLLSYTLESVIVWIEKRRKIIKYSRLEWFTSEKFQLQRLAHEELGVGTWDGCTGVRTTPVTGKGQLLAILDIEDPEHPRLKVETKESAAGGNVNSENDQTDPAASGSESIAIDQTTQDSENTTVGGQADEEGSDNTATATATHMSTQRPESVCSSGVQTAEGASCATPTQRSGTAAEVLTEQPTSVDEPSSLVSPTPAENIITDTGEVPLCIDNGTPFSTTSQTQRPELGSSV